MTLEEQRARMLKLRLDLINEYLILEFAQASTGKSFADFLKYKKISRKQFIKGLPKELQNPPAKGKDALITYGNAMNQYFINQHLIAMENEEINEEENQEATESAQYLGKGKVDPDYLPSDIGLMYNCDGCRLKKFHNADGECDGCPAEGNLVEEYENPDEDESDSFYNASAGCGVPPIPPPFPKIKSIKKSVEAWDKYNAKKKKYQDCRKQQKASGHNLAAHLLNLSNPMSAIGRGGFLDLVSRNFLGFAQTFIQMKNYSDQSFWNRVKKAWYDFGGNPSKLDSAVERGKNKKAIWRRKGWKPKGSSADGLEYTSEAYLNDGGAAEIAGVIAAAAVLLGAIVPIVKSFRKAKGQSNENDADLDSYVDPNQTGEPGPGVTPDGGPVSGDLSTNMKLAIGIPLGLLTVGLLIWGVSSLSKSKSKN